MVAVKRRRWSARQKAFHLDEDRLEDRRVILASVRVRIGMLEARCEDDVWWESLTILRALRNRLEVQGVGHA